jgi:hypothetical protein
MSQKTRTTDSANLITTTEQAPCSVGQVCQGCTLIHVDSTELRDDGRALRNKNYAWLWVWKQYIENILRDVTLLNVAHPTRLGHLVVYGLNLQKFAHKASLLPSSNRTVQKNGHTMTGSLFRRYEIFWWSPLVVCAVGCRTLQLRPVINVKKMLKEIKLRVDVSSVFAPSKGVVKYNWDRSRLNQFSAIWKQSDVRLYRWFYAVLAGKFKYLDCA